MKTFISLILSLIMAVLGLFGNLIDKPEKPDFCSKEEFDIYTAVNEIRKDAGVHKLELDGELCRLARIRAEEQTKMELKGHTRPDGTRFYTVFLEHGVYYQTVGENICITSQYEVDRVINGWYDSQSHRENMLNTKWTATGVGIYETDERIYIVQLFAC